MEVRLRAHVIEGILEMLWQFVTEMWQHDGLKLIGVLIVPVLWPVLHIVFSFIRVKCSYETCPLIGFARTMFGG